MKTQSVLKKAAWLLAMCFATSLVLAACKSASDQPAGNTPAKAEHPQSEHPTQSEHPK